jgi:hypothetical protein
MSSNLIAGAFFLILGVLALTLPRSLWKTRKYAPGPPGIPLLGNFHKLTTQFRYKYIQDISKTYGSSPTQLVRLLETLTIVQEI